MKQSIKIAALTVVLVIAGIAAHSQATIGANQTPNKDAVLDLVSANKGLLLPRIAETARPSAPTAGLVIFNTTQNEIQYFDGQKWVGMADKATDKSIVEIRKESLGAVLNVDAKDAVVVCTNAAAGKVILPSAANLKGKTLYVKASGNGNVMVAAAGGSQIDGVANYEIPGGAKLSIMFVSDGADWNVLD